MSDQDHGRSWYGPNTPAVEEVIAFVESGGVLRGSFVPPPGEPELVRVIRSFEDLDYYQEIFDGSRIAGDLNWTDIGRIDGQRFPLDDVPNKDDIVRLRDSLWPIYEAVSRQLWMVLRGQLDGIIPEVEISAIHGDLTDLIFIRSIRGILAGSFKERLFCIYRAGGYPCGWEGRFPEGRLVVFSR